LKRNFSRLTALAARGLKHFAATATRGTATAARAETRAAGSTLRLARRAAFRATIRLILEAFTREELLLAGTKNKLAVAINAA
jgi:hypothetical protein